MNRYFNNVYALFICMIVGVSSSAFSTEDTPTFYNEACEYGGIWTTNDESQKCELGWTFNADCGCSYHAEFTQNHESCAEPNTPSGFTNCYRHNRENVEYHFEIDSVWVFAPNFDGLSPLNKSFTC